MWFALGVVGFLVFHVSRDVERKERWHAPFTIGTALLFLAFALSIDEMGGFRLVMVPAVALVTWSNLRMFRFCRECGRTVYHHFGFGRPQFCPSCGAALPRR